MKDIINFNLASTLILFDIIFTFTPRSREWSLSFGLV